MMRAGVIVVVAVGKGELRDVDPIQRPDCSTHSPCVFVVVSEEAPRGGGGGGGGWCGVREQVWFT